MTKRGSATLATLLLALAWGAAPAAAGQPDLIIQSAVLFPPGVSVQQSVYVRLQIKNQGSGPAVFPGYGSVRVLTGTGLNYVYVPSSGLTLAAGEAKTYYMVVNKPKAGKWSSTVKVDPDGAVAESNESNNSITVQGSIGPALSPNPKAGDLVPLGCTFNPANPTVNDFVSISITVKNTGSSSVLIPKGARQWTADVIGGAGGSGGVAMSEKTVAGGATYGGGVNSFVKPGKLAPGTYDVVLSVDDDLNRIGESNDNNNQTTCKLSISPGEISDLVITSAVLKPLRATMQRDLYVDVTVKNQGNGKAVINASYQTKPLFLYGPGLNYVYVPSSGLTFQPGESKKFQMVLSKPAVGAFSSTIKVDPQEKVTETSESNNTRLVRGTIAAGVSPQPRAGDLVPKTCSFSPQAPKVTDAVGISIQVKNVSSLPVFIPRGARQWSAKVIGGSGGSGGVAMSTRTVAGGGTYGGGVNNFVKPGKLAAGYYKVELTVDDALNRIAESNDTNNRTFCTLTIRNADGTLPTRTLSPDGIRR